MDAIYNVLGVKSSFYSVFSLNYVTISTNKKIRNEYPASTGSLAGSKRVISTFNLSSTRTNLHQSRHVEIDAAGLQPGFDKKVESMSQAANSHELVENLAANLVENQVCSWLE